MYQKLSLGICLVISLMFLISGIISKVPFLILLGIILFAYYLVYLIKYLRSRK